MKPQATIKLLTGGVRIGLVLLAGIGFAAAQTSPAQRNDDLRKVLNQATQTNPQAPATANKAPATAKAPETKPAAQQATGKPPQGKPLPVKVAAPPAQAQTKPLPPAPSAPKAASKPAVQSAAKPIPAAVPNPHAPDVKPEVKEVAERSTTSRRDPFNPLISKDKGGPAGPQAPLPAGKPGLVIATLRVDGIVHGPSGMIAVVSNPQMRVYFLREGDHLYDGEVSHITMEGVSFHEAGKDAFGKPVEREATKRLYPTPGEQQ